MVNGLNGQNNISGNYEVNINPAENKAAAYTPSNNGLKEDVVELKGNKPEPKKSFMQKIRDFFNGPDLPADEKVRKAVMDRYFARGY